MIEYGLGLSPWSKDAENALQLGLQMEEKVDLVNTSLLGKIGKRQKNEVVPLPAAAAGT